MKVSVDTNQHLWLLAYQSQPNHHVPLRFCNLSIMQSRHASCHADLAHSMQHAVVDFFLLTTGVLLSTVGACLCHPYVVLQFEPALHNVSLHLLLIAAVATKAVLATSPGWLFVEACVATSCWLGAGAPHFLKDLTTVSAGQAKTIVVLNPDKAVVSSSHLHLGTHTHQSLQYI